MIFASRRVRAITFAAVMSSSFLNGCISWQPVNAPVPEALGSEADEVFQVRLADGRKFDLWDAHVASDSLMGTERRSVNRAMSTPVERERGYTERVVKVALVDVESISRPGFDAGKTALVLVGLVAAFFILGSMAISDIGSDSISWY
jgi:hypothetical protein